MCLCSCSPACGIVRSCTASKTSELSILGALFSQDQYVYKGGFLHFFSSSLQQSQVMLFMVMMCRKNLLKSS